MLSHATLPWDSAHGARRPLFYKFSPHATAYSPNYQDPAEFSGYADVTERMLAILEPPNSRFPGRPKDFSYVAEELPTRPTGRPARQVPRRSISPQGVAAAQAMPLVDVGHFESKGFAIAGSPTNPLLTPAELAKFSQLFDADRAAAEHWKPYYDYQMRNCEPLLSNPAWDGLFRHPKIIAAAEALLGGPVAMGEACLRWMGPQAEREMRRWHRDAPHALHRPRRCGFVHLMLYLSDVDHRSPCWSISPEGASEEVLGTEEQLQRGGTYDLEGPAGTAAFFNLSCLHTATVRPCTRERKSVQVYYAHQDYLPGDKGTLAGWILKLQRGHTNSGGSATPAFVGDAAELETTARAQVAKVDAIQRLSDFTSVPPALRNHRDAEVRAFYGNLKPAENALLASL